MGYAYSNDGLSFRAWNDPHNLAAGEVYFAALPSTDELAAAFPNHGAAAAATERRQAMTAAVAAGCALVSTGTPGLSATYDAAGPRWQQMKDEAQYIATFNAFSGGLAALDWPALSGAVNFATTDQFKAVARAVGDWLTLWQRFVDGQAAAPATPVTIA